MGNLEVVSDDFTLESEGSNLTYRISIFDNVAAEYLFSDITTRLRASDAPLTITLDLNEVGEKSIIELSKFSDELLGDLDYIRSASTDGYLKFIISPAPSQTIDLKNITPKQAAISNMFAIFTSYQLTGQYEG